MFGATYFGKTYFGGSYFGPGYEITVTVRPRPSPSVPGADLSALESKRTIKVTKQEFDLNKQQLLQQLLQEDEELIEVVIAAIYIGIL